MPIKKIYELILVDSIWDNWEHMGWVTDLKDAAPKFRNAVVDALVEAINDGAVITRTSELTDGISAVLYLDPEMVEKEVVMPDDFLQEYVSTFCMCIDRPYITIEELVDECLPGWELEEMYDGDCGLCIRGFIHEWPIDVVDRLMVWEDAGGTFEKMEDADMEETED